MSKKRKNSRKDKYLAALPTTCFDSETNLIAHKCKFNFAYMDFNQKAGQSFGAWTKPQICKLLDKLQNYSGEPLQYWANQRVGGGGNKVFVIYDKFPIKSDFVHPKNVPSEARWARFRLEGAVRLVGFLAPEKLHDTKCKNTQVRFDTNTFYVVFLDGNHRFYL